MVTIEVICTRTNADIEWQDGEVWSRSIPSTEVRQAHHIDDNDFCPGDFVFDERNSGDMHLYGLVLSADNANRMATVQWFRQDATNNKVLTLNKEELSVYEVADHPGFHFRISDIIIRVSSISDEDHEEQQLIGELLQVNRNGKLKVLWSDGSQSEVYPQEVMPISPDEESFQDSSSGDEESGSDESWETAASDVDEQTVMEEIMEECIAA
uniref:Uncharacterized protein n=1 Tax=Ciona savignyi TaxID=51511 RepID=H2YFL6_CIOSA